MRAGAPRSGMLPPQHSHFLHEAIFYPVESRGEIAPEFTDSGLYLLSMLMAVVILCTLVPLISLNEICSNRSDCIHQSAIGIG